ncbi:MAG: FecR domain-containing protein [Planctomycetota bacterium]
MKAIAGRTSRFVGLFILVAVCCGVAAGQEGIARISEFAGEVQIQRGEEIIRPVKVGQMIRNGSLINADMIQTRKGTASVLFEDGSQLKLDEETLIVINPPMAKVQVAAQQEAVERRIRIVVGKVWNFIEPKSTAKTLFELPDGVAAVRGCSSTIQVTWSGSYRLIVETGTYLPSQFSAGVSWEQGPGCDVRVDRTPNGIRITNAAGSKGPITITYADGTQKTLQPGEHIDIPITGKVQIGSLTPFPYYKSHNQGWQMAMAQWDPRVGAFISQPVYVQDDRRDAHQRNSRLTRSVFNRRLNRGSLREPKPSHCGSPS